MQSNHYRKIELQSPADLTYLYTNTVALSRQKLDLHFPPSAYSDGDNPDPMKERVKELVDQFIRQTYTHASDSISINGLEFDSSTIAKNSNSNNNNSNGTSADGGPFPFPSAFSAPETIEYEAYDSNLASRVSSLYAQLESLTTTVAQLRRDAPGKAARTYGDVLNETLSKDDAGFDDDDETQNNTKDDNKPEWKLDIPFGTQSERERWHSGEMAEVYADTLRTLLRLQGEQEADNTNYNNHHNNHNKEESIDKKAISTTVATAERAERAVEFVERM